MFWQRAMHDHCIIENNHMNESPYCNADWHMNQNISNEMISDSLSSKSPCSLDSPLSLCRPSLNFYVSSEQFSENPFFANFPAIMNSLQKIPVKVKSILQLDAILCFNLPVPVLIFPRLYFIRSELQ